MGTDNETDLHKILIKMERYCAYQERCSWEVRNKLKELNVNDEIVDQVLSSLKENDFQNEERYARLFASGKFRIKKWGKIKVASELKKKKIPTSIIQGALNEINATDYRQTIIALIQKKEKEVKKDIPLIRNQKIFRFVLSKGFESAEIMPLLKEKR